MKRKNLIYLLFIMITMISFACNLTNLLNDNSGEADVPGQAEVDALHITQTALVLQITQQAIDQLPEVIEVPEEIPTDIPEEVDIEEVEEIAHELVPGDSGAALEEIFDTSSAETGEMGYISEGDYYENGMMLERPFMPDMVYRPDIDIIWAEIASDGPFITATIHLHAVNPQTQNLTAHYGIEIDTDLDGRGDFLIWTAAPQSTEWMTDAIMVYADTNDDIGGETTMESDAPMSTQTDGFETIIFSKDENNDPDGAFSRLLPGDPAAVQLSFKASLINKDSFLWSAWADDGLKSPGNFNYHDQYTFENAGSPIDGHIYYPLKQLYAVDNTCRMGYNENIINAQIGTCGTNDLTPIATNAPTTFPTISPSMIPTGLPDITP